MKIKLNRDYRGRMIQDRLLKQGVHEVDQTIATYLIGKGYAVPVDDATPVTVETPVIADEPETMTYADVEKKIQRQAIEDSQPKARKRK